MNKQDIIYIAGLFDGEGCITIRMNRPTPTSKHKSVLFSLVTKVTMCHEDTIKYLYKTFGIGHFREATGKNMGITRSRAWSWTCMSNDAIFVIKTLLPYLRTKHDEAIVAIDFSKLPTARKGRKRTDNNLTLKRKELYEKLRNLKTSSKW